MRGYVVLAIRNTDSQTQGNRLFLSLLEGKTNEICNGKPLYPLCLYES